MRLPVVLPSIERESFFCNNIHSYYREILDMITITIISFFYFLFNCQKPHFEHLLFFQLRRGREGCKLSVEKTY